MSDLSSFAIPSNLPPLVLDPHEYVGFFLCRGPQSGTPTGFALSPNGQLILSSTNEDITLLDTRSGRPLVWILTGSASKVGAIEWFSVKKCFLGTNGGHIYIVTIGEFTLLTSPIVSISYSFQDIQEPIKVLRWDNKEKLLAIGYDDGVAIWKTTGKKWKVQDHVSIAVNHVGICALAFFGTSLRCLFIAGGFGYAIWRGVGQTSFFRSGDPAHGITDAVVSADGLHLAATTFSGTVKVWPVDDILLGADPTIRAIISGGDYRIFRPFTPVKITPDGFVAVGTQVGKVELSRPDGSTVDEFSYEENWAVMGLLNYGDRMYVQYMGPVGAMIIVGWVNNVDSFIAYKRLNEKHPARDIRAVYIDINLIPKGTLAGSPMQTGRVGFSTNSALGIDIPLEASTKGDKESNKPSKPNTTKAPDDSNAPGSLSSVRRCLVLLVTSLLAITFALVVTSDWFLRRVLAFLIQVMRAADRYVYPIPLRFALDMEDFAIEQNFFFHFNDI
ncbi:hypothetical protein FRC12_000661 [Ceratobasidium sp. 428]|nr:hypothetical protein FRC12_000661 [Ceratobasidium sp. 428]